MRLFPIRSISTGGRRTVRSRSRRRCGPTSSGCRRRVRSGRCRTCSTTSSAGREYLGAALAGTEPSAPAARRPTTSGRASRRCLDGLADPGALERTCMSPLGFEWTVLEADGGHVHGPADPHLGPGRRHRPGRRASTRSWSRRAPRMFLPEMPERGRAAGIVGPAVDVGADDDRRRTVLLAAMGRRP